ncbi:MAG: hypothetical protein HKN91_01750 [Acidimicrobiia bacterium]|nr:hypothetical protein [Acidimicrobiia bacterium]
MTANPSDLIEELLRAVGDLLAAEREQAGVVVVGGAALAIRGFVDRVTKDVDVIALAEEGDAGWQIHLTANLPEALQRAAVRVARDFGLDENWLNAEVGALWVGDLPRSFSSDIEWRTYGGLTVGYVGRTVLIALKLFAAVDSGPADVHFQDLCALRPSDAELEVASAWVEDQDEGTVFPHLLRGVVERYRAQS